MRFWRQGLATVEALLKDGAAAHLIAPFAPGTAGQSDHRCGREESSGRYQSSSSCGLRIHWISIAEGQ